MLNNSTIQPDLSLFPFVLDLTLELSSNLNAKNKTKKTNLIHQMFKIYVNVQ